MSVSSTPSLSPNLTALHDFANVLDFVTDHAEEHVWNGVTKDLLKELDSNPQSIYTGPIRQFWPEFAPQHPKIAKQMTKIWDPTKYLSPELTAIHDFAEGLQTLSNANGNFGFYGIAKGLLCGTDTIPPCVDTSLVRQYWSGFVDQYPEQAAILVKVWDPTKNLSPENTAIHYFAGVLELLSEKSNDQVMKDIATKLLKEIDTTPNSVNTTPIKQHWPEFASKHPEEAAGLVKAWDPTK